MQQHDRQFIDTVYGYYHSNSRDLPWRHLSTDTVMRFYQVLVSEIMLQQTQVARVVTKYSEWMKAYPKLEDSASVPLIDILSHWQGLGYNRRGKFLHDALRQVQVHGIPNDQSGLVALPGVGTNTAGAIMAYAFNQPAVFIETNIRSVYIYHYFSGEQKVHDREILPIIERTLNKTNPREWYWALMDYGSHLKTTTRNNARSIHYSKQSTFKGSSREIRAKILRLLIDGPKTLHQLSKEVTDHRLEKCLDSLLADCLVEKELRHYRISS